MERPLTGRPACGGAGASRGPIAAADPATAESSGPGPLAAVGVIRQDGQPETSSVDAVIVPPTGNPAEERRLPIFDAVESNWFKGGRRPPASSRTAGHGGSSPADDRWR